MSSTRPSATPADSVVEEWGPNSTFQRDRIEDFHRQPSTEVEEMLMKEAETNGVEKPKGYTVSYHYNAHVENYHFGEKHPMKPWRLQLTKQLVLGTGLHYAMDNYRTLAATKEQLSLFHSRDYVDFLSQ